ncbi:hypothetical protein DGo_PB0060 (plasmid) [Deinococcus gobiensis I-0]|uniref:Uncharacterized protein n=1 Tax=Deinococcus gobiensis (strain DSM 21396 / JCM 16679 / CGMCC 1.7299 / I-0) TaxID=745776 RepID=H8H1D2_DEIGI|nr:hypothetical protein DGo_PB0060 [Deinococcus gobiensis I-0]
MPSILISPATRSVDIPILITLAVVLVACLMLWLQASSSRRVK